MTPDDAERLLETAERPLMHFFRSCSLDANEAARDDRSMAWPWKSPEKLAAERRIPPGGVYFIQCGQFVKIGKACDIEARLRELELGNPHPMRVLGWEPVPIASALDRERALHQEFAASRHRGEWFKLEEPLITHIKRKATRWPKK